MNRWHDNWDAVSPIFKFSKEVRTAFYTTNTIESLNSCYRRLKQAEKRISELTGVDESAVFGNF